MRKYHATVAGLRTADYDRAIHIGVCVHDRLSWRLNAVRGTVGTLSQALTSGLLAEAVRANTQPRHGGGRSISAFQTINYQLMPQLLSRNVFRQSRML